MHPNQHHSYNLKHLPKGCQYCVKGEKLVVFVTGICPRHCHFCPVSDEKYQKDVIFANERKLKDTDDLIAEAEMMQAKGAGITGGDPLSRLDRTCEYIKKLKERFRKEFHIHLYTSLELVNENTLKKLHDSGLDEIRFHLDLEDKKLWERIKLSKKFFWDVGVEVPLIPEKENVLQEMIDYLQDKVDFVNFNELEVADNAQNTLLEKGAETKDQFSYAVKDSIETGLRLLEYSERKKYHLPLHACTAKLKDSVQLANRIKRESERARHPFDLVNEEGILTRGALYFEDMRPDFGYRKRLHEANKEEYLQRLLPLLEQIKKKLRLKDQEIFLDKEKPRILLSKRLTIKKKNYFFSLGLRPAIVMEYPTTDQLEVEVEFLDGPST